ncbi:hypothetical protein [Streptomyces variabilis]
MIPAIASRVPLVRRSKAPALPLEERINHLTGLTVAPAGASHHDLVARACGVLNYAALIASDVGLPRLAEDLCWRQHQVFANAGRLSGRVALMSLMPLVNLARLETRAGHGELAYSLLHCLNDAARHRNKTDIDGRTVDLSALTGTDEDHRAVCQELYVTLLVDGARALAQIGRWTEAADAMAQHRGIGNRLLDGRQIKIMALMEQGPGPAGPRPDRHHPAHGTLGDGRRHPPSRPLSPRRGTASASRRRPGPAGSRLSSRRSRTFGRRVPDPDGSGHPGT